MSKNKKSSLHNIHKVKALCPSCSHDMLTSGYYYNAFSNGYISKITCDSCGLMGIGDDDYSAYYDMIKRAPLYQIQTVLETITYECLEAILDDYVDEM